MTAHKHSETNVDRKPTNDLPHTVVTGSSELASDTLHCCIGRVDINREKQLFEVNNKLLTRAPQGDELPVLSLDIS